MRHIKWDKKCDKVKLQKVKKERYMRWDFGFVTENVIIDKS